MTRRVRWPLDRWEDSERIAPDRTHDLETDEEGRLADRRLLGGSGEPQGCTRNPHPPHP